MIATLTVLLCEICPSWILMTKIYLKIKLKHNSKMETLNHMTPGCYNTQYITVSFLRPMSTSDITKLQ